MNSFARVTASTSSEIQLRLDQVVTRASDVIFDKEHEVKLALCCLLAEGNLLIEDIPGVGKTTLVKTLAKLLNLRSSRIQFTNDLLPADIIGSSIFDVDEKRFVFHPGPIFSQIVLADELNRATPKTQSACLQAMEEMAITVDGHTHHLPQPFFLIATQNPRQQVGTFPLPESQLDRFLMRIELGYPSREAEKKLLTGEKRLDVVEKMSAVLQPEDLVELQRLTRKIHLSEPIINYLQDLVAKSRDNTGLGRGLSPRGALALTNAAKAWAFLAKRPMVLPEDVQAVAIPVMSHRLNPVEDMSGESGVRRANEIISQVRVD